MLVKVSEIVERGGDRWLVRAGVMGGEVAIDGQRLAVRLVGVGEAAGVLIEDSEIGERGGDIGPVGGWVMGGEVAADGQRLAVGPCRRRRSGRCSGRGFRDW